MKKTIKEKKDLLKNLVFVFLLIVLAFQFKSSFIGLIDIVDNNQVYVKVSTFGEPLVLNEKTQVFLKGQRSFDEILKKTSEKGQSESYVKVSTLKIYTYKLLEIILLLFGIFMCLIFMAINNRDFSLIDLLNEEKK